MHWIAPTEKDAASATLEKNLWDAADQFRANSGLKAGDIIRRLNGGAISGVGPITRALATGQPIWQIDIFRDGRNLRLRFAR